jgi:hypothetical protein
MDHIWLAGEEGIRTFNLLIQSELRYRCATPQFSNFVRLTIRVFTARLSLAYEARSKRYEPCLRPDVLSSSHRTSSATGRLC